MRRKLEISALLFSILLICLNQGCTDPGWVSRESRTSHVAPEGFALWGAWFADANTGTAVGHEGIILNTSDGGDSWSSQTSGTGNSLQGVCYTDTLHGWVVGTGTILHTNNGGNTWITQISGASGQFTDVYCLDTSTAWVVGSDSHDNGTILHTSDGGATWIRQRPGLKTHLFDVFFTDPDTGTAVGGWCENCIGSPLYGGYILNTTDGGNTWLVQYRDTTMFGFYAVDFTDARTGIVVGAGGTILRTTNGGVSWDRQASGTTVDLRDVCFTGADTGTAVGGNAFYPYQGGTIIRTTNGGITWSKQEIPIHNILLGVSFTDARTGTAVGLNTILNTISGGKPIPRNSQDGLARTLLQKLSFYDPFNSRK